MLATLHSDGHATYRAPAMRRSLLHFPTNAPFPLSKDTHIRCPSIRPWGTRSEAAGEYPQRLGTAP